jgi:hypothetical protein
LRVLKTQDRREGEWVHVDDRRGGKSNIKSEGKNRQSSMH